MAHPANGKYPNPIQYPRFNTYKSSVITSKNSPYGQRPLVEVPGFAPVYRLLKEDRGTNTFVRTGFQQPDPARTSLFAVPVPSHVVSEEQLTEHLDNNIAILGATWPSVQGDTAVEGKFNAVAEGATDVKCDAEVYPGDTLVWEVPTPTQVAQAAQGTELQRMNPSALRIVPLKKAQFASSVSAACKKIITPAFLSNKFDAILHKAGAAKRKASEVELAAQASKTRPNSSPLYNRQQRTADAVINHVIKLLETVQGMAKKETLTKADASAVANHVADIATIVGDYGANTNRHIFGVSTSYTPAGGTAHTILATPGVM